MRPCAYHTTFTSRSLAANRQHQVDPAKLLIKGTPFVFHSLLVPASRIMKRALPENAKMSKEAKTAVQECVSEFIGFITSEASDRCALRSGPAATAHCVCAVRLHEDKRKTITGDDSTRSLV